VIHLHESARSPDTAAHDTLAVCYQSLKFVDLFAGCALSPVESNE
jgi:hypothetical protein